MLFSERKNIGQAYVPSFDSYNIHPMNICCQEISNIRLYNADMHRRWSDGAMVLGKFSVPGRPTNLDKSRARAYCTCSRCVGDRLV